MAIARALVNRPELLLADEPTGALDTATGEEIGALLLDLNASGQSLVLVTHNPDLAARYASRTVQHRGRPDQRAARPPAPPRHHRAGRGAGAAMRPGPVARAARGGLTRRRVQTIVIGLVLLVSTGASVLALALVVDSSTPFDHAFAAQRGAHVIAMVDPARATAAELAATTRLAEVTAAAGPFAEVTVNPKQTGPGGELALGADARWPGGPRRAARSTTSPCSPGTGRTGPGSSCWPATPAPAMASRCRWARSSPCPVRPGKVTLTVVGIASSVDSSAGGWVLPSEIAKLRAPGTPPAAQMLYRFRDAGTATAIRADVAAVTAALPAGAVTGTQSYLAIRAQETSNIAPFVPFVVAFGSHRPGACPC